MILQVHPLDFYYFSLLPNVFINIYEYANLIICICYHRIKALKLRMMWLCGRVIDSRQRVRASPASLRCGP